MKLPFVPLTSLRPWYRKYISVASWFRNHGDYSEWVYLMFMRDQLELYVERALTFSAVASLSPEVRQTQVTSPYYPDIFMEPGL